MSQYLAVAPHYWGRGNTPDEAVAKMRKAGFSGRAKGKVRVGLLPPGAKDAYVDQFGMVCWEWEEGADTTGKIEWSTYS